MRREIQEAAGNSSAGEGLETVSQRGHRAGRKSVVRATPGKRGERLGCYRLNGFAAGGNKLRENEVTADTSRPEVNCCLKTPQIPTLFGSCQNNMNIANSSVTI